MVRESSGETNAKGSVKVPPATFRVGGLIQPLLKRRSASPDFQSLYEACCHQLPSKDRPLSFAVSGIPFSNSSLLIEQESLPFF